MKTIMRNGSWEMKRTDLGEWRPAAVPGSVYADLLAQGQMPDPFYRDNEEMVLALSDFDYEYRRSFTVTEDDLKHDMVELVCDGLDTLCDLYINDQFLAHTENMHRRWRFDLRPYLTAGENQIRVHFSSPNRYVRQKHEEMFLHSGSDSMKGISHLRKGLSMFGWDWGPMLPDMGIWRDISVEAWNTARISDVHIRQNHQESGVELTAEVSAVCCREGGLTAKVCVFDPSGTLIHTLEAPVEGGCARMVCRIAEPALWYPNNLGDQPLYRVETSLQEADGELDRREERIGLRTMEVIRKPDAWGESFAFSVNGLTFFAAGGDYIPEDNILARCTTERSRRLLTDCAEANYNMIRIWGGAYYPSDEFYEICDELGLLVWQDLMFACGSYDFANLAFRENIRAEVIDNLTRLRNHPSLALICGNNEEELAWMEWGWKDIAPGRANYTMQFDYYLKEIAEACVPDTLYWPSSPSSGGGFAEPNGQNKGDMHCWDVWHGKQPFTYYRRLFPRFMSEFGVQSFPCMKTVESFTEPEDRNIYTKVMEAHQKNGTGNEKIMYYVAETFRFPHGFENLLYLSQLCQGEAMRYGVEHWRRNRNDLRCMGTLYWQINDCWPVASWAGIDYFGRWKVLHHFAKRFYAPVLLSVCEEGSGAEIHISNERPEAYGEKVYWQLMEEDGRVLAEGAEEITVPAFTSVQAADLDFSAYFADEAQKARTVLYCWSGEQAVTTFFVKPKYFDFRQPEITVAAVERADAFELTLRTTRLAAFAELSVKGCAVRFDDNYFALVPGHEKRVTLAKRNVEGTLSLEELKKNIKIKSLYDSWEKF